MFCLSLLLAGCGGSPVPVAQGRVFSDALGRQVRLPDHPERIVSLAPGMTELLYALGLEKRIVGRTDYCNYPPQAAGIASVGGYINPNLERLCALKPDLVLAMHGISKTVIGQMERSGLTVAALNPTDLEGLYGMIGDIGRITGNRTEAETLCVSLRKRQQAVSAVTAGAARPSVFYVIWDEPLFTAGGGTFIDDIIAIAGGRNIASGVNGHRQFSREQLLAEDPDIILYSDKTKFRENLKRDKIWRCLKAVRSGHVYPLDEDIMSRPGPRLFDGLEKVASLIHPNHSGKAK
ncbi:MAG: cobalamin-binding protein [bacterium]|nr:cobalamin-binding protein [bacterium]